MYLRMDPCRVLLTLAVVAVFGGRASGQCILANPSFEIGGTGGAVFGGWNQFGLVGAVSEASHGARAARVSGPITGDWDVSGFWQTQDCQPGEQWEATGHVRHPAGKPLTGQTVALAYIEWHDSAGGMIDFDSFTVADAGSPTDEWLEFSVTSSPAPAGTVLAFFLLAVLQSPTDPSADVIFDQVTFNSTSYPTVDDRQWNDFPGGRTLTFGGRTWRIKGPGVYGPGNNYFMDTPEYVWVDASDRLHLTVTKSGGPWVATEVVTEDALGYGDYILTTVGRLDLIDPQVVLGIFLWEYGPCWDYAYFWWNPFNEIDVEYSRWGDPSSDIGQFVAQPFDWSGNIDRFDMAFGQGEVTSHAMRWLPDRVEYRVWRGGPDEESPANMVHSWTYTGPHIPRPEQPRMHLNLWIHAGAPAENQEVIFEDFTFVHAYGVSDVLDDAGPALPAYPAGRLHPAAPNPFNPRTEIRFDLAAGGITGLDVYDLNGRRVRTLADGYLGAGEHRVVWNGLDDGGRPVASGVYMIRLRGSDYMETRRVTLVK